MPAWFEAYYYKKSTLSGLGYHQNAEAIMKPALFEPKISKE
jgi:hypothetical protein